MHPVYERGGGTGQGGSRVLDHTIYLIESIIKILNEASRG